MKIISFARNFVEADRMLILIYEKKVVGKVREE
jgi:hypothetical protein